MRAGGNSNFWRKNHLTKSEVRSQSAEVNLPHSDFCILTSTL